MDILFAGFLMMALIFGIATIIAIIEELLANFSKEKKAQDKEVFYTYRDWSPNAKDGKL